MQPTLRAARRRLVSAAALELGGLATTAWALWELAPWLGKLAAGAGMLAAGFVLEPRRRGER